MGKTVCDFMKKVWANPSCIAKVNPTNICLIPKVHHPHTVALFRPISLCNTLYKVVSKVIMDKLNNFIVSLVSPYQTGFGSGRSIHENIIIAQEVMNMMQKKKGKKRLVCNKD